MGVGDSVLFSQLVMKFEARLEKVFKQLDFLKFPRQIGHRCRE